MTRDGEVKQRQHFYHHGDTTCHPKSGYVTTKLRNILLVGWYELHMLMRNNYSEQLRQRRGGRQNSRANDNAISAWAIIGNFTFELIFHIKWVITRLTVPWLCRVLYYTCTDFKTSALLNACEYFVHAAATVWNALPVSVTSKDSLLSFKAALKTHLCASAYTWLHYTYNVMNNAVIIIFLKMCYYYYSLNIYI